MQTYQLKKIQLQLDVNLIVTCVLKIPGSAATIAEYIEHKVSLDIVILLKT